MCVHPAWDVARWLRRKDEKEYHYSDEKNDDGEPGDIVCLERRRGRIPLQVFFLSKQYHHYPC